MNLARRIAAAEVAAGHISGDAYSRRLRELTDEQVELLVTCYATDGSWLGADLPLDERQAEIVLSALEKLNRVVDAKPAGMSALQFLTGEGASS